MKKGAALIGLGLDNVRLVPCDSRGKMDAEALGKMTEQAKAEVLLAVSVSLNEVVVIACLPVSHSQSVYLFLILSLFTCFSFSVCLPVSHSQSVYLFLILSLFTCFSFSVCLPVSHSQSVYLFLVLSLFTCFSFSVC